MCMKYSPSALPKHSLEGTMSWLFQFARPQLPCITDRINENRIILRREIIKFLDAGLAC